MSKDAEENAPGYDLDPTGTSVLSSNIAKEEKSHIDIQTALNQQACNLTRRIHGEEEEDNTEQWNAEERSSAMEFGHGNRPLTAKIQGRRAVLGSLTHGSRVPTAYKELSSILSKDFKGLY